MNKEDLEPYKVVEIELVSLYKGCFQYEGEHEGRKIYVCGGTSEYKADIPQQVTLSRWF